MTAFGCELELSDEQDRVAVDRDLLHRVLSAGCRRAGSSIRVSVALVDDETIAELHDRFLGIPGPTDVLSFPLPSDPEFDSEEGVAAVEGEVVVSTDTAFRTAQTLDIDPLAEVCLYALHGLLHLLGFDDHEADEFDEMHGLEREVMIAELGVDPGIERRGDGGKKEGGSGES